MSSATQLLQRILQDEAQAQGVGTAVDPPFVTDNEVDETTNKIGGILSNIFLFFLIFGLSATVQIKDLKKQISNLFAIGCGVAMQFIIMPILGYCSVMTFRNHEGFTESMGITLLVVTASPGGSFSNWWCSLFNADLALSVAMTTVSSLLSIAMLPANLFLWTYLAYDEYESAEDESASVLDALDFNTLFITLGVVLTAIISGLAAGAKFDNHTFHETANRFASVSGFLLILFSIFLSSGGGGSDSNFWNQHGYFYIAVSFPCLFGIILANLISRAVKLSPPETVAIAIECCYQNTGIATSVAISMFSDPDARAQAVAVPVFYGFVEAFAIAIYCVIAWKLDWTKAPANEHICTVITKSYEINQDEGNGIDHSYNDENKIDPGPDPRKRTASADATVVSGSSTP